MECTKLSEGNFSGEACLQFLFIDWQERLPLIILYSSLSKQCPLFVLVLGNKHTWENSLNSSPQCLRVFTFEPKILQITLCQFSLHCYSVMVFHISITSAKMVFILKTNYLAPPMWRILGILDENQNPLQTSIQSSMRTEPIQSLLLLEYESYIHFFLSLLFASVSTGYWSFI